MSVTVPGKELTLGGKALVLPPLNAAATKQYRDQIKEVFAGTIPDIELVAKLAHAAFTRNYPEMTLEEVENLIDYGNFVQVWESLLQLTELAVAVGEMQRRVQTAMAAQGSKTSSKR